MEIKTSLIHLESCFQKTGQVISSLTDEKWQISPANGLKSAKELIGQLLVSRWVNFQFIRDLKVDREKFGTHIRRIAQKAPSELIMEEEKMSAEMMTYFTNLKPNEWELTLTNQNGKSETVESFLWGIIEQEYHHRGQVLLYFDLLDEEKPVL